MIRSKGCVTVPLPTLSFKFTGVMCGVQDIGQWYTGALPHCSRSAASGDLIISPASGSGAGCDANVQADRLQLRVTWVSFKVPSTEDVGRLTSGEREPWCQL